MKRLLILPVIFSLSTLSIPVQANDVSSIDDGSAIDSGNGDGMVDDGGIVDDGSIPDEILQSAAGGPEVQRGGDQLSGLASVKSGTSLDAGDWLELRRKKKLLK